jgi:NADH-quinone oxidoreductase subunit H
LVKVLIMAGFVLNLAAILTWADRRQSSMIQDRVGPNRAVVKIFGKEFRLAGLLHPAADGLKFFTKEDFMPPNADKLLFIMAPIMAMGMVFTLVGVIPFGDTVDLHAFMNWQVVSRDGTPTNGIPLIVVPLEVGLLYVFAMAGQGIIGAAIAGWASDNKFSLMGALRAASQMVSYEVTMGMSLAGALMIYGKVNLDWMVTWQQDNCWGIFVQPLAFFLFFTAAVAENKRIPFDLPEAESELVSGYFTEYAGMKFGMFYFAEYAEVVTGSMLLVTIFLGGWALPFFHRDGLTIEFGTLKLAHLAIPHTIMILLGVLVFFGKVIAVCFLQVFVRWALPRFRYDQLMKLGWRILLPLSFANILVTGIVVLGILGAKPEVQGAAKVVADITQAIVAVGLTVIFVRGVLFFFGPVKHHRTLLGSSAEQAATRGGTKTAPMQA